MRRHIYFGAAGFIMAIGLLYLSFGKPGANPGPGQASERPQTGIPLPTPQDKLGVLENGSDAITTNTQEVELVNPDPANSESGKLAKVILEAPETVYQEYIESAELGDPTSQFLISKSLQTCRYVRPTREQLEDLGYDHNIDQSTKALVYDRVRRCEALYNLLPGTATNDAHLSWLNTAAANGSSIASLEVGLNRGPGEFPRESFNALIPGAFEEAGDNIYLKQEVLSSITSYMGQFAEWREQDLLAWELLLCRYKADCAVNSYFDDAYNGAYREHEVDSFAERANQLERAIENRNWSALDL